MRRGIMLTERDLTRIVKRVLKEGFVLPELYEPVLGGDPIEISCTSNSYIKKGNKTIPLSSELYNVLCNK